jgi:hypothetical protein
MGLFSRKSTNQRTTRSNRPRVRHLESLEDRNLMTASPLSVTSAATPLRAMETTAPFIASGTPGTTAAVATAVSVNTAATAAPQTTQTAAVSPVVTRINPTVPVLRIDWFSQYLPDAGVQNLARNDFNAHGTLTRSDMLGIFSAVEQDGTVSMPEYQSLVQIAENPTTLHMSSYLASINDKVIDGDPADRYAADGISPSGVLVHGVSSVSLSMLVNDFYYGEAPLAGTDAGLQPVNGTLFRTSGPYFGDTKQGSLGDCTLLAALAEVADRAPQQITGMFTNNGDGTYGVRFYEPNGQTTYVTVNSTLPDGGSTYDQPVNGILWVALAEKATVEVNESGWLTTLSPGSNSYLALNNGNSSTEIAYLQALTGAGASAIAINPTNIAAAWNSNKFIEFGTSTAGDPGLIVGEHAYAMVNYSPSIALPFTLYNPWGLSGGTSSTGVHYPGLIEVNAAALQAYFAYDTVAGAATTPTLPTKVLDASAVAAATSVPTSTKTEDHSFVVAKTPSELQQPTAAQTARERVFENWDLSRDLFA